MLIHVSNVMYLIGESTSKIGMKKLDDGSKVRFLKTTNESID